MKYTITSEHVDRELSTQVAIGFLLGFPGWFFGPLGWVWASVCWYTAGKKLVQGYTVMNKTIRAGEENG